MNEYDFSEQPAANQSGMHVPQQRIMQKIDEYMSRRDYPAVERHLLYWLEEARQCMDKRGELMILNEMVGHYRKTGEREHALQRIKEALELLEELNFDGSISAGTTYVNCATALHFLENYEVALELFEKARKIYEVSAVKDPKRMGGLYNNMGLTLMALGRYEEALKLYDMAMENMRLVDNGELEQAMTCLNIANLVELRDGLEGGEGAINDLLDTASKLLHESELTRDGYYAFVCEKCAPTFEYYGYFAEAEELKKEARGIFERD